MDISENIKKYLELKHKVLPYINFKWKEEVSSTTVSEERIADTYQSFSSINRDTASWINIHRLSDGRYIVVNPDEAYGDSYNESGDVVQIFESDLVNNTITISEIDYKDSIDDEEVFIDNDNLYFYSNSLGGNYGNILYYITKDDDYSVLHSRELSFDFDPEEIPFGFLGLGKRLICKVNGIYYMILSEHNQSPAYLVQSTDLTNFTLISELDTGDNNGDEKMIVFKNNIYYYTQPDGFDSEPYFYKFNTASQEISFVNEQDLEFYNEKYDWYDDLHRWIYDDISDTFYYVEGVSLYRKDSNGEVYIGDFLFEPMTLLHYYDETDTLHILAFNDTQWQEFTTITDKITEIKWNNIEEKIARMTIDLNENAVNPQLNANFFVENDNDKEMLTTINKTLKDVAIRTGREIEVSADFPVEPEEQFTLYRGFLLGKEQSGNKQVPLKAISKSKAQLDKKIEPLTLFEDTLENTIQTILLKHPDITVDDIDFDTTNLMYPGKKYSEDTLGNIIKDIIEYYPSVKFYYGLDGKYKLKIIKPTNIVYNLNSDVISQYKFKEEGTYSRIVVKTNGLYDDIIEVVQEDSNLMETIGEKTKEFTTTIHKTKPAVIDYSKELMQQNMQGFYELDFTVNTLAPVEKNDIITVLNADLNIDNNNKWVIIGIKQTLGDNFKTRIICRSYYGGDSVE
ncbi:hypothetical protein ACKXGF_07540 [Alkalibacillus sp. S2W]|uniref:hypothetical protein n=1 Tax=Alkalibacillus sp. S2W TaxID=3386553 RepID=UPI00398CAE1B